MICKGTYTCKESRIGENKRNVEKFGRKKMKIPKLNIPNISEIIQVIHLL